MSIEEAWDAKWSEELDRRGLTSVVAALSGGDVRPGRGAEFPLFLGGTPNPSRGYVEDWISRKEAVTTKVEARRFWCIFVAALLAVVVGIIAAWPVIHDWIIE
jgi:hypothetical protein